MRTLLACFAIALVPATSFAHFLFILPANGKTPAQVILSDTPTPDPRVTAANVPMKPFTKLDTNGRTSEGPMPALDKSTGVWSFAASDDLGAVLFSTIDYGVANRGEDERWLLRHHAKYVQNVDLSAKATPMPLDIAVRSTENGLVFTITVKGVALPNVDVFIHEPGETKPKVVRTDLKGQTPAYSATGQYGVRVNHSENTAGEFEGRRYKSIKNYATLIVVKK